MKKNQDNLKGVRWVTTGFVVIALIILALQVMRVFKVWNVGEFGTIFVTFLAWLLVFWGATQLMQQGKTWKKMWILSIAMAILVALEGFVAFRNVRGGMLEQSFIDVKVMFIFYLTLLGLFYGHRQMLKWAAMAVKGKDATLARKCMKAWLPACAIVMITLILIPITGMFAKPVEYIGTGVMGIVCFLAQGYMCSLVMQSYQLVIGKTVKKSQKE